MQSAEEVLGSPSLTRTGGSISASGTQALPRRKVERSEFFNNSSRLSKGGGWGGVDIVEFSFCLYENWSRWWFRGIYAQTRCRPVSAAGTNAKTCHTKEVPELRISLPKVIIS